MKKLLALKQAILDKGDWKIVLFHTSWAITLTSGLSYFFGLMRDRVFAHMFGLSRTLDIYNASFVVPEFVQQVVLNAALSAAFLPIFAKLFDANRADGYDYANRVISWAVTLLVVILIFVGIFMPAIATYSVPGFSGEDLSAYIRLSRIMLITPIIFAFSGVYGRMLLSVKEFFWWGLAPVFYNIGIILGAIFLVPYFGINGLVMGTIVGALLHMGIRLYMVKHRKYKFKHAFNLRLSPAIKETAVLTAPKIIQYALWSFMLLSFTSIASKLTEGSVAAYGWARNFQSLPVSLLGIAISLALYPTLCHDAARGNFTKFRKDLKRGFIRSFSYTILAAIVLAIFSTPLIRLLLGGGAFDEDAILLVSMLLKVYCLAIPLESLLHMFHRGFYSLKNTWIPATLHAVIILITIMTAKNLAMSIGIFSIPISFAGWMLLQIILLAIIFPKVLKRKERLF